MSPPPADAPPKLTEAERAKLLAGVRSLVYKRVIAFKVPPQDRDDAAADVTLRLWELSATFDPAGPAKWSTYATTVANTVLKNRHGVEGRANYPGGFPTCEVDDLRTPDPATLTDPDDGEDDDLGSHAGAMATLALFNLWSIYPSGARRWGRRHPILISLRDLLEHPENLPLGRPRQGRPRLHHPH